MAKLSAREAAATKSGGSLNYKTGKISTPVKAPSVRQTAAQSVSPLVGAGPLLPGQVRISPEGPAIGPLLPGQSRPAKSSTPDVGTTSNRKPSAPKEINFSPYKDSQPTKPVIGGGTISGNKSAAPSQGVFSDFFSKLGQAVTGNSFHLAPQNAFLTEEQRQENRNNALGIPDAQAAGPSALESALAKGSMPDITTGYGPNGEKYFNGYDPSVDSVPANKNEFSSDPSIFSRAEQLRNEKISYGSQPTSNPAYVTAPTARNPRQIASTNIPNTRGSSNIQPFSSLMQQVISHPDFQSQFDNTPVNTGRSGTQRQFLGNGVLGNGVASNGKLDSQFEGASFGAPMNQEENLLNQLLGINTTQTSENPQQDSISFGNNVTPMSAFTNKFANDGLTLDQDYSMPQQLGQSATMNPTLGDIQNNAGQRKQSTAQPTNTSAQFSQGATGGNSSANPMLDYQKQSMKGFSAQEKAQKQALNELLKSIKNQYNTKQESGLQDLNKAKQEDLLKLSGLFSFANQDPNSEQRIQYEQRANQDYAGQEGDFLAKLAAAMSGDISQAKQGYQGKLADINSQRSTAQYNIAQLLQKAKEDALSHSRSTASAANSTKAKQQAAIQTLLNRAANMPSGGREFAQQQANQMGLGNISAYTPNGWENAYNPNFGQAPTQKLQSIGNGYVMNPNTGDVFQAYDPNAY